MKNTLLSRIREKHTFLLSGAAILYSFITWPAFTSAQAFHTAETSYGLKLGHTRPLYAFYGASNTDQGKLNELRKNKPHIVPNFIGRRPLEKTFPGALPSGADPRWQDFASRTEMNLILPSINIEGINEAASASSPPDVAGDIGRDYYVETVNATFWRVYNKMGQPVSPLMSANAIWTQVGQSSAGDPIILYDQAADRWLLTEFAPVNKRRVLLAISDDGDPRGSWTAYTFQTPQFPDFPKYSIWPDGYYLTTNENGFNFPIYAFNRDDMHAGKDTVRMQRLTVPKIGGVFFEVGQPVDWQGAVLPPDGSPGLVVKLNDDGWGTTSQDAILLHKTHVDWEDANQSNIQVMTIPTAPFDTDGCSLDNLGGFSCVPQPNGQGIDGAEWIITNSAQYRNFGDHESIVLSFMVDVTGGDVAGIRWIELRKTPAEDWHLFQEGTVGSDDGIHRFMSSISMDGQGSIGLCYAVSGFEKFPSLRYTGRHSFDPPGEMTFQEIEVASGAGSIGHDRYGDYFHMGVDPSDETTFWFAGQYIQANSDWSTRIVAFNAGRDTLDVLPVSLSAPQSAASLSDMEPVQVSILNRGLRTVYQFAVSYQFDGGAWVTETAALDSLLPDGQYLHTFASTLSFPAIGPYSLRVATDLDLDGNRSNDTASYTIIRYAHRDAALEYVVPAAQNVICGDASMSSVILRNVGGDTLYQATLLLTVGNHAPVEIPWTGALAFGEAYTLSFLVPGLEAGVNAISMDIGSINGETDQVPDNNLSTWSFEANPEGQMFTLQFRTDNFPAESSWKLFDENNQVIASDGPFGDPQHTYTTTFCLSPEACYTFTVFDAFGDGMHQGVPPGDFEIYNVEGEVVAQLAKPNFGSQSSSQFCVTGQCMLALQVGVSPESQPGAVDAVAIAETTNSLGLVSYSLDGGQHFQPGNLFPGLAPGHYTLIAQDGAGCLDTVDFDVLTCQLQALITTQPAVGGDVGQIHIAASGALGTISYSLNGGAFTQDSFFVMLEPGVYIVTVRDSAGCALTDTVEVSTQVGTSHSTGTSYIAISPNPGEGIYQISANFATTELFVPYTVFTAQGESLVFGTLVRYNAIYRDELSLRAYPSGVYYVVFQAGEQRIVRRVIKIQ